MRFARADYDRRIIDVAGKIPEDEPVWLLRAQDAAAPDTLDTWAYHHELRGGDRRMSFEARLVAQEMREWQASHGKKTTDVPADPDADLPDREVPMANSGQGREHLELHVDPQIQVTNLSIDEFTGLLEKAVGIGLAEHAGEDEHGHRLYRLTAQGREHVEGHLENEGEPETPPAGA